MKSNLNSKYTQYLSSYDLICKYKSKSIYKNPKLKKIVIEFSLDNNFNSFLKDNELNYSLKIKSIFLLYNFFTYLPYIKVLKKKLIQHSKKDVQINTILKYNLTKEIDIYKFLILCYIEMEKPTDGKIVLKGLKSNIKKTSFNNFVYKTQFNCYLFPDFEFLLQNYFSLIYYKSMQFKVNFIFENFKMNYSYTNLIKNLFLFWKI